MLCSPQTAFFKTWLLSVPGGGWLGHRRESHRSDAASTCCRYLCKSLDNVPLFFFSPIVPTSSLLAALKETSELKFFSLIGGKPCCRGARGSAGTWGGLYHPVWWLLWSPRHKDQGTLDCGPALQFSVSSGSIWSLCLSVSDRWDAGPGDDGWPSFEQV